MRCTVCRLVACGIVGAKCTSSGQQLLTMGIFLFPVCVRVLVFGFVPKRQLSVVAESVTWACKNRQQLGRTPGETAAIAWSCACRNGACVPMSWRASKVTYMWLQANEQ